MCAGIDSECSAFKDIQEPWCQEKAGTQHLQLEAGLASGAAKLQLKDLTEAPKPAAESTKAGSGC